MAKNPELNHYSHQDFICDNCQNEFQDEIVYSQAPSLTQLSKYATYCFNCVEINNREIRKQSALRSQKKKTKDFGVPPVEASENLRSLPLDKRTLRKTNRIHQFNTSVSKEWMAKLKVIAYEERLKYVEVLEKALECYSKYRKK